MLGGPENNQIKLIDFGFACELDPRSEKEIAGSPRYLAPEIFTKKYDEKIDIWSLGVTLMYLLTGEWPFDGTSRSEVFSKIKKAEYKEP